MPPLDPQRIAEDVRRQVVETVTGRREEPQGGALLLGGGRVPPQPLPQAALGGAVGAPPVVPPLRVAPVPAPTPATVAPAVEPPPFYLDAPSSPDQRDFAEGRIELLGRDRRVGALSSIFRNLGAGLVGDNLQMAGGFIRWLGEMANARPLKIAGREISLTGEEIVDLLMQDVPPEQLYDWAKPILAGEGEESALKSWDAIQAQLVRLLGSFALPAGSAAAGAKAVRAGSRLLRGAEATAKAVRLGQTAGTVGATAVLGAGDAVSSVDQWLDSYVDEYGWESIPRYRELVDGGLDPAKAETRVRSEMRREAGAIGGTAGAVAGVALGRIFAQFSRKYGAPLARTMLRRIAKGAGLGALEEGIDEGGVATGTELAIRSAGLDVDSFNILQNTVQGAFYGAVLGGAAGGFNRAELAAGQQRQQTPPEDNPAAGLPAAPPSVPPAGPPAPSPLQRADASAAVDAEVEPPRRIAADVQPVDVEVTDTALARQQEELAIAPPRPRVGAPVSQALLRSNRPSDVAERTDGSETALNEAGRALALWEEYRKRVEALTEGRGVQNTLRRGLADSFRANVQAVVRLADETARSPDLAEQVMRYARESGQDVANALQDLADAHAPAYVSQVVRRATTDAAVTDAELAALSRSLSRGRRSSTLESLHSLRGQLVQRYREALRNRDTPKAQLALADILDVQRAIDETVALAMPPRLREKLRPFLLSRGIDVNALGRRRKRAKPSTAQTAEQIAVPQEERLVAPPPEPQVERSRDTGPATGVEAAPEQLSPEQSVRNPVRLRLPRLEGMSYIGRATAHARVLARLTEVLGEAFRQRRTLTVRELLDTLRGEFDSADFGLMRRLVELSPDTRVQFGDPGEGNIAYYDRRTDTITLAAGLEPHVFGRALLHEMTHAATMTALREGQSKAAKALIRLYEDVTKWYRDQGLDPTAVPQLRNLDEFVASLYSEPQFVDALDRLIAAFPSRIPAAYPRTVWGAIKYVIARLVGVSPKRQFLHQQLMDILDDLGRPAKRDTARDAMMETAVTFLGDGSGAALTMDHLLSSVSRFVSTEEAPIGFRSSALAAKNKTRRVFYKLLSLPQLHEVYGDLFDTPDGGNLFEAYRKTREQRDITSQRELNDVIRNSERWVDLRSQHPETVDAIHELMVQATLWEVHPDKPITDAANIHLRNRRGGIRRYRELAKRWQEIGRMPGGAEAQQLYGDTLQMLDEKWAKFRDAILKARLRTLGVENLPDRQLTLQEARDLAKAVGDRRAIVHLEYMFTRKGPYFPLRRFGDYYVVAETRPIEDTVTRDELEELEMDPMFTLLGKPVELGGGKYRVTYRYRHVQNFDSEADSLAARQKLEESGKFDTVTARVKSDTRMDTTIVPAGLLQAVADAARTEDPAVANALAHFLMEIAPETSIRKALARRMGVSGAETNMIRSLDAYGRAFAYSYGQIIHGAEIQRAARALEEHARSLYQRGENEKGTAARDLVNTLHAREKEMLLASLENRRGARRVADVVAGLGFYAYLTSIAYWVTNMLQPTMVTYPVLAARYGATRALDVMLGAYRDLAPSARKQLGVKGARPAFGGLSVVDNFIANLQRADERAMMRYLSDVGLIDVTLSMELDTLIRRGGKSNTPMLRIYDTVREWTTAAPHFIEVVNRMTTGLAAMRLAREQGIPGKDGKLTKNYTPEQLQRYVAETVRKTQVDYGMSNRPLLFQKQALRPLLLFKMFGQAITYLYTQYFIEAFRRNGRIPRSEAAKALGALTGVQMLFSGLIGATWEPIMIPLKIASAVFGIDDPEEWMRSSLQKAFGKEFGLALAKGLPYAAGVDMSRLGVNNLLFNVRGARPWDTPDNIYLNVVLLAGGAPAAMLNDVIRGSYDIVNGDFYRGFRRFMPSFARSALSSIEFATTGLVDRNGNPIVDSERMSLQDILVRALGYSPTIASEAYAFRNRVYDEARRLRASRRDVLDAFWRAVTEGGEDAMAEAFDLLARYNATARRPITPSALQQSLRERRRRREEIATVGVSGREEVEMGRRIRPLYAF
ncbi:MAG TPA: PLxRFG domain-containing protein [bacterium]|nr:PLxRFG domain-containing protein [bacterium]